MLIMLCRGSVWNVFPPLVVFVIASKYNLVDLFILSRQFVTYVTMVIAMGHKPWTINRANKT